MLASYATGIAAILVLLLIWLGVQVGWRKVFADLATDPDALAGRIGCHGCSCEAVCEGKPPGSDGMTEEEHHERTCHAAG